MLVDNSYKTSFHGLNNFPELSKIELYEKLLGARRSDSCSACKQNVLEYQAPNAFFWSIED